MRPHRTDDGLGPDFPARRLLELIAHKWTPIVIYCLSRGPVRFGELHRGITGISKKMLIQVLRQLEADGLVDRKVYEHIPPRTEYTLTAAGERIHEPIAAICRWAMKKSRRFFQPECKPEGEHRFSVRSAQKGAQGAVSVGHEI
jgi:DNA-binding HxlR family transcriptional regulator